jgi:hypothetical protein
MQCKGTVPTAGSQPGASTSRGDSSPGASITGTSTPKGEANDYVIECTNCSRSLAASRFASHLSACMGLTNGARRARTNSKPVLTELVSGSESEAEIALESTLGKGKPKTKTKQTGADDAEFDLKRKRPATPQASPPKPKARRGRPPGSTNAKKKGEQDGTVGPKTGSKKSMAAQARRSSTPGSSRFSSPGLGLASSRLGFSSNTSPVVQNREPDLSSQTGLGSVPILSHQPSPPRPAAVHDFDIDVDGDETGSSTDTDSS